VSPSADRWDEALDELERERVWQRHEAEHETPAPKSCWICREEAERDAIADRGEDLHGAGA
jgi:hypothetical protein